MALGNTSTLGVCLLLILFVVTMVGIDEIVKLADLAFEVVEAYLGIVEVGFWRWGRLVSQMAGLRIACSPAHLSFGYGARGRGCGP